MPPAPPLDPVTFCRDPRLLGFALWPAQEVILRAAYGLAMPPELLPLWARMSESDRPYAPRRYSQIVLVIGRQSGKSRLTRAATAYSGLIERPAQWLPEAEYAQCTVVATSQLQARDVFVAALGRELRESEVLRAHVVEDDNRPGEGVQKSNKDQIVLDNRTLIRAIPCNSRAGRGYTCFQVVYDEISSYAREVGSPRADVEVVRSIDPAMRVYKNRGLGRVWMISNPQAKEGVFWKAYDEREKRRDWQLTLRAPSWLMDPGWDWEHWRAEQASDPEGFSVEYGAEFCEMIEGLFTREEVDAVLVRRGPLPPAAGRVYWGRIDPAFVRDNFGIGVGHAEGEWCRADHLEAVSPPKGGAVSLQAVLEKVQALHRAYKVRRWTTDQYAGEPIAQLLRAAGIPVEVQPWGSGYKRTIYSTLVAKARARRFEAPWSALLDRELVRLQSRRSGSGQVSIGHPAGDGETDDLADVCAGLAHDCASQSAAPRRNWEVVPQ